tara:strand:+ start:2531 stop:3769 length:1239 start_codon:yes stop_codon:yes gene_type:complete
MKNGETKVKKPIILRFTNVAHFYSHMMMLVYPTVVIALETIFRLPFGELLALSLTGFILYGVAALPAGWLGDRWSAQGMLVIFFFGTGLSGIAVGLATDPLQIAISLGAIGLFSSIYHPVGTALVVANSEKRGKALGINGVFGTAGIAATPIIAASLASIFSWRYAFIVPGVLCLITGLWFINSVKVVATAASRKRGSFISMLSPRQVWRGLGILCITVFCVGLLAQATTVAMPKIFAVSAPGIVGKFGLVGAGGLASIALAIGALGQLGGGWLADRYRLTIIYPGIYIIMIPLALLCGYLNGLPLVVAMGAVMFLITCSLPTENSLVAHYCPELWHARAYGAKFVLGLGISSLAIPLTGKIYDITGGFWWVFCGFSIIALVIAIFGAFLPSLSTSKSNIRNGRDSTMERIV